MTIVYIFLAVLAIVIVTSFLSAKRRVGGRMRSLLNAAKVIVYTTYEIRLETSPRENRPLTSQNGQVAAAATNYLFGEEASAQHLELDLNAIHRDAIAWIRTNDLFKELVVQSLRVASQLAYMQSGKAVIRGEEILSEFGSGYPTAPDPDRYSALVNRLMDTLPLATQANIRKHFGSLR